MLIRLSMYICDHSHLATGTGYSTYCSSTGFNSRICFIK